ncbi:MAG TPA: hypothetical protein VK631_01530 [Solirubrobacteraceae bacterium]|nr:hypothetical protein [Solirubrobacteraceae bacterium]
MFGNRADGIEVNRPEGFTVTRNSIADNGGLGIDLVGGRTDPSGVTRNSKGGPNFPQLRGATDQGGATAVEGHVDAADPASITVELFASDAADPSGFGEGQTFVGTTTPDARGRFTATLPGGLAGKWLTATARYASGTTSEFSEAVLVPVPNT